MAEAAAESFDLLLVSDLLPLGQLQSLQNLFHVFEAGAEGLDDSVDFLDCLLNRHRGGRVALAGWRRRGLVLCWERPFQTGIAPWSPEGLAGGARLWAGDSRILRHGRHRGRCARGIRQRFRDWLAGHNSRFQGQWRLRS